MVRGDVAHRRTTPHAEHHFNLVAQAIRAGSIRLVHREDVGDLHETGLERLDRVARLGDEHDEAGIRGARHVEFTLSHANRLDEDAIDAECVEHVGGLARRRRESAKRTASRQ
jgi:hypothetical protein